MFRSVTPLDSNAHRNLKLAPNPGFGFAATTMTVPLSPSEVPEAAKHFPVVFPTEGPLLPHALLSLVQGTNEFVSPTGEWTAPYVPAHIRRYPFILAATGEKDGFVLGYDSEAPHFVDGTEPLLDADGKPTVLLSQVLQFLNGFQQEITAAATQLEALTPLLDPQQLEWQPPNGGDKVTVNGLRIVNVEKLSKLSDKKFLELRKAGLLPLIYAHLSSLSNVAVLTQKAATRLAAK
jgi:hypothetical protein